jgi:magnesium chelatase subunit I
MITPLKDRFGAQIRTHYPLEIETEMAIVRQEAAIPSTPEVRIPDFMEELIARFTHLARRSSHVNQRSGVSVRLTVSNMETLAAAAVRRSLALGEDDIVPRVCDLDALISSTAGKIEVESLDEGRDAEVIDHLLRSAILEVFKEHVAGEGIRQVVDDFDDEVVASAGDDLPVSDYMELLARVPSLAGPVAALCGDDNSAATQASAIELILEGLHLSKRLNKDAVGNRASYRGRL